MTASHRISGRVRLEVKGGGWVGNSTILPYVEWPEVLIWGDRVFTFRQEIAGAQGPYGRYEEALVGHVLVLDDAPMDPAS